MRKNEGRKTPSGVIADELEGWASGAYAVGKLPDILSATEVVAEHWQTIVKALRKPITVTDAILEKCKSDAYESDRDAARYECEAQKSAATFCRGKAFAYTEVRKEIEAALKVRSEE